MAYSFISTVPKLTWRRREGKDSIDDEDVLSEDSIRHWGGHGTDDDDDDDDVCLIMADGTTKDEGEEGTSADFCTGFSP
jgi:hypothetical protein